jgi:hypothetical protein
MDLGLLDDPPPDIHHPKLGSSQVSQDTFLKGVVVSPTPNPQPGVPGLCIHIPGGSVAQLYPQAPGTHFSSLLRHAWTMLGLFLFPGHPAGDLMPTFNEQIHL